MNPLISQYIDDELSLDEKVDFVGQVHASSEVKNRAVELLEQEKSLRQMLAGPVPIRRFAPWWKINFLANVPKMAGFAAAVAVLVAIVFLPRLPSTVQRVEVAASSPVPHRFVIYNTGIEQAEISGTFTDWKKIPMQPAGSSGYWAVTLPLAAGEHRYIFILNGREQVVDPTVPARENDDFGAANSILLVEA
jgi:hypothetical protein